MNERVSALIDGELEPAAANATIDGVLADPELRSVWTEFHRVGDGLRSEELLGLATHEAEAAARFARLLDAEPVILAPRRGAAPGWARAWTRYGKRAVAASAAAAMVALSWWQFGPAPDGASRQVEARAPAVAAPLAAAEAQATLPASSSALDRGKLAEYVSAHHQASAAAWRDPSIIQSVGLTQPAGR